MAVRVQADDFDLGTELRAFQGTSGIGAVVTFTGLVRRDKGADLREMVIEHYPAMTQKALEEIERQAQSRWTLAGSLIIHRFGALKPGEQIMMVATASAHRAAAFAAAEFLMDYLKSRAPFWKKEIGSDGAVWVDSKAEDESAIERWT